MYFNFSTFVQLKGSAQSNEGIRQQLRKGSFDSEVKKIEIKINFQ